MRLMFHKRGFVHFFFPYQFENVDRFVALSKAENLFSCFSLEFETIDSILFCVGICCHIIVGKYEQYCKAEVTTLPWCNQLQVYNCQFFNLVHLYK
jgi:hypothetical protein